VADVADRSTITAAPARPEVTSAGPAFDSATSRRWRALRANPVSLIGGVLTALFLLIALAGPLLAPYDPMKLQPAERLRPPSASHWLGTDDFGRDVLTRMLYGTRVSMSVSLSVVVLCASLGIVLGLLAGYYRRVDAVLMRVLDGLMAFPAILLAIAIAAVLRPSITTAVVALTIVYVPRFTRVMRAPVLVAKETLYVDAARAAGASDARILLRHLLPNSIAPLTVQATFTFAFAILAEAALSFLGVGVPPPAPSWGGMLNDGRQYMAQAWWMTVGPGAMLMTATLALNLFGDGLRDVLDPRHFTEVGRARG
jgi:peptide/nickel transport system permease protein